MHGVLVNPFILCKIDVYDCNWDSAQFTVAAIEAFRNYLTKSFAAVISQILKSNVHNFLFIDESECSRIRYSILIGQLKGSCESFKKLLRNFEELIRETGKLEQMNWSNIFGTLLLPRL